MDSARTELRGTGIKQAAMDHVYCKNDIGKYGWYVRNTGKNDIGKYGW